MDDLSGDSRAKYSELISHAILQLQMPRMKFIPELKDKIIDNLRSQGLSGGIVDDSFRKWENDEEPSTPWEKGCFAVFAQVQKQIENG